MINAISYSLEQVERKIPKEILRQTFVSNINHRTQIPINHTARIMEEVLVKRVFKDINIIGGTTIFVELDKCILVEEQPTFCVYHVPKELTGNRSIASVHEMHYGGFYGISNMDIMGTGSRLGDAAKQQLDAVSPLPHTSEGRTSLINDNTIMIEGYPQFTSNNAIRCIVEYDLGLVNINGRAVFDFSKLVVLATKSYIYNNNVIKMDQGQIAGGANLGMYKDVIDSYSDAEELYDEYLTIKWAKIDKLNDYEQRKRLINLAVGAAM